MTTRQEIPASYKIDGKYLVAISSRWGQSSGEALIAEFKQHRPGSADRVPPDDIQDVIRANIVRAANSHAALWGVLYDLVDGINDMRRRKVIDESDDDQFLDVKLAEAKAILDKAKS